MLRGASAEARAELVSQVGSSGSLEDKATLGDQLLGVAGVLRSEAALRRVFTDASIEGEAKAGLAGNVFGTWNASFRYWFIGTVSSFVANQRAYTRRISPLWNISFSVRSTSRSNEGSSLRSMMA